MESHFKPEPKRSALLLIDFQNLLVKVVVPDEVVAPLFERSARLLSAAREIGLMVIHVIVEYRPGHPEVSKHNKMFGPLRTSKDLAQGSDGAKIYAKVLPIEGEPIVVKHRVGSFAGTDLETILRSNDIDTIILAGIATSGAILSTVRHAFDMDYAIVVATDCCTDQSLDVHKILMEKIFPPQAEVLTAEQIIAAFC